MKTRRRERGKKNGTDVVLPLVGRFTVDAGRGVPTRIDDVSEVELHPKRVQTKGTSGRFSMYVVGCEKVDERAYSVRIFANEVPVFRGVEICQVVALVVLIVGSDCVLGKGLDPINELLHTAVYIMSVGISR